MVIMLGADLFPFDEAHSIRRLVDAQGLPQDVAARRVGKRRAAVANAIRLLGLDPEIRRSLVAGEISEGHARALLALPEGKARTDAWREILKKRFSVRETEALVRKLQSEGESSGGLQQHGRVARRDAAFADIEMRLRRRQSTRVTVAPQRRGASITIDCYSTEEFEGVHEPNLGEEEDE
jgi:ParB family chromosome partitioning protein